MKYKFFDFCSGIGSGRIALEKIGFKCIGHSEINPYAEKIYKDFFKEKVGNNYGDLMSIKLSTLPNFNFMLAGFPCQPFSIVGKREGFNHNSGNIIYGLCKILQFKEPDLFLLENVKGIVSHNKGNTLKFILNNLRLIGYDVFYKILNSNDFGTPQHRERIYLVGFHKKYKIKNFYFPKIYNVNFNISNFLINENNKELSIYDNTFNKYLKNKYNNNRYTIEKLLFEDFLVIDTRQSDIRLYKNKVPTLRAGRHGIIYTKNKKMYRLSAKEAFLLQGYSIEDLGNIKIYNYRENELLSLIGNAMTVTVIKEIANSMEKVINEEKFNSIRI